VGRRKNAFLIGGREGFGLGGGYSFNTDGGRMGEGGSLNKFNWEEGKKKRVSQEWRKLS